MARVRSRPLWFVPVTDCQCQPTSQILVQPQSSQVQCITSFSSTSTESLSSLQTKMISRNSLADEDVTGAKPPPSYGTIRTERLAVVMKQVYFHRRQRRTSVHINFKQNPSSTEVVSSGEAQDLHSANEWKETSRANVPLLRPAPKKPPGLGKGIKAILFASRMSLFY